MARRNKRLDENQISDNTVDNLSESLTNQSESASATAHASDNVAYQQNFETEQKANKKKNKIWFVVGIIFNVLALALVFIVEQTKDQGEVTPISEVFKVLSQNYQWVLLAIAAYLALMIGDGLAYLNLGHCATGKYRAGLSLRVGISGRYYDSITPLASGGQPFQIYYLSKGGIEAGKGSSIIMSRYIIKQIIFTFILLAAILTSAFVSVPFLSESAAGGEIVKVFAYIGVIVTCAVPLFLLIVAINKRLGDGLVRGFIKFLHKIRLVKRYDAVLAKTMNEVNQFQNSMKYVFKRKRTFFLQILLAVIDAAVFTSIPYFIYRAFGNHSADWSVMVCAYAFCLAAVSFFPTPGTAGAAEASFYVVFAGFFTAAGTGKYVFWALLLWRFFTYYVFIIAGLILIIVDFIRKSKEHKRQLKNGAKLDAQAGDSPPVESVTVEVPDSKEN